MLQNILRKMESGKYYVVSHYPSMAGPWNHKIVWEGGTFEQGVQYIRDHRHTCVRFNLYSSGEILIDECGVTRLDRSALLARV